MKRRALFFDGQMDLRHLLWRVFVRRGYEIFCHPDPSVCPLNTIIQWPGLAGAICADVIVSDLQMLQVHGIGLVRQLIEKKCMLPQIAVISGSWTGSDRKRALQLGYAIFEKPFDVHQFIEWLDGIEMAMPPERCLTDLVVASGTLAKPG
jgi:DNA-binding response OmpR family regulator